MKTYGEITHEEGRWILAAEPHVILRAKRVFAGASRQYGKALHINSTIDNSRDLQWFCERYPLFMTDTVRALLDGEAGKHRERESVVRTLLAGMRKPREFPLAIAPREYQRVGADMALSTRGLLLADDVGIGKTCTGICVISDPSCRPALVVTLTHLTRQWEREIKRFAPKLTTHVLSKGRPYDVTMAMAGRRRKKADQLALPGSFPDVIITSYSKIAGWAETLAPLMKSVVWDEVQELRRGEDSQKGAAAAAIADAVSLRLGLSATPIYNYGGEIYNVMRAIAPGALGEKSEFHTEWTGSVDSRGRSSLKDPKAFGTYMRDSGLMLRRTREDVGRELPGVVVVPHTVDMDDQPLKEIQTAAERLAHIIIERREEQRGERMRASEELSYLVRHATGVGKAPYVAEFVRLLVESGEPVVLYGWHHDVYSIWRERLAELRPAFYTGTESTAQKEEAARRFVAGETDLMILSLRSGAGLDGLQARARTVVFGELDWSPGVHEQCIGRIERDGQAQSVVAYYLIADEGSDPIVADTLQVKRAQVEGLRNPAQDLIAKLDVSGERIRALARQYLGKLAPSPSEDMEAS